MREFWKQGSNHVRQDSSRQTNMDYQNSEGGLKQNVVIIENKPYGVMHTDGSSQTQENKVYQTNVNDVVESKAYNQYTNNQETSFNEKHTMKIMHTTSTQTQTKKAHIQQSFIAKCSDLSSESQSMNYCQPKSPTRNKKFIISQKENVRKSHSKCDRLPGNKIIKLKGIVDTLKRGQAVDLYQTTTPKYRNSSSCILSSDTNPESSQSEREFSKRGHKLKACHDCRVGEIISDFHISQRSTSDSLAPQYGCHKNKRVGCNEKEDLLRHLKKELIYKILDYKNKNRNKTKKVFKEECGSCIYDDTSCRRNAKGQNRNKSYNKSAESDLSNIELSSTEETPYSFVSQCYSCSSKRKGNSYSFKAEIKGDEIIVSPAILEQLIEREDSNTSCETYTLHNCITQSVQSGQSLHNNSSVTEPVSCQKRYCDSGYSFSKELSPNTSKKINPSDDDTSCGTLKSQKDKSCSTYFSCPKNDDSRNCKKEINPSSPVKVQSANTCKQISSSSSSSCSIFRGVTDFGVVPFTKVNKKKREPRRQYDDYREKSSSVDPDINCLKPEKSKCKIKKEVCNRNREVCERKTEACKVNSEQVPPCYLNIQHPFENKRKLCYAPCTEVAFLRPKPLSIDTCSKLCRLKGNRCDYINTSFNEKQDSHNMRSPDIAQSLEDITPIKTTSYDPSRTDISTLSSSSSTTLATQHLSGTSIPIGIKTVAMLSDMSSASWCDDLSQSSHQKQFRKWTKNLVSAKQQVEELEGALETKARNTLQRRLCKEDNKLLELEKERQNNLDKQYKCERNKILCLKALDESRDCPDAASDPKLQIIHSIIPMQSNKLPAWCQDDTEASLPQVGVNTDDRVRSRLGSVTLKKKTETPFPRLDISDFGYFESPKTTSSPLYMKRSKPSMENITPFSVPHTSSKSSDTGHFKSSNSVSPLMYRNRSKLTVDNNTSKNSQRPVSLEQLSSISSKTNYTERLAQKYSWPSYQRLHSKQYNNYNSLASSRVSSGSTVKGMMKSSNNSLGLGGLYRHRVLPNLTSYHKKAPLFKTTS